MRSLDDAFCRARTSVVLETQVYDDCPEGVTVAYEGKLALSPITS